MCGIVFIVGDDEKCIIWFESLAERDDFGNLAVHRRIILKWILK
jgi:hypothetical protein